MGDPRKLIGQEPANAQAAAWQLVAEGMHMVLVARRKERIDTLAAGLGSAARALAGAGLARMHPKPDSGSIQFPVRTRARRALYPFAAPAA